MFEHSRWMSSRLFYRGGVVPPASADLDPRGSRVEPPDVQRRRRREEPTMSRRYDDPVEVRRRDEEPAEFVWRGRLYVIRGVLAHWIETAPWWAARGAEGSTALALDGAEREVWRVEASRGRSFGTGVYDVSFDWAAGGWTLRRALD
jgi:hypothetical protein